MYIRVNYGTCEPSRVDDVSAVLRDAGLPLMRQEAGFQNAYIGFNRETGRGVIVSMWDTQEQADVSFAGATDLFAR